MRFEAPADAGEWGVVVTEVALVAPALIVAAVLLVSGIAKLRNPDDEAGWQELGVPAVLRKKWLIRLHPVGEIVLAVAVVSLGGWLGVAVGSVAALLFIAYLVAVWVARRRSPDASCACFGARQQITTRTILRNAWLVLLALASAVAVLWLPVVGGALWLSLVSPTALIALGAVALTMWLAHGPASESGREAPAEPLLAEHPNDDELADYIPRPIPAVPVEQGNGDMLNLQRLAALKPILLLAVSETCGSCIPVIERAGQWRELLPEVSVRFLLKADPARSALTQDEGDDQSLHDQYSYVRDSIGGWKTPSAVLLGTGGLLAGGPVEGEQAISAFVDDIYEQLHGEPPTASA